MTKTVRIENADTNNSVELVVSVQDKLGVDDAQAQSWKTTARETLGHPTRQIEVTLTDTSRVIIEERKKDAASKDPPKD